MAVHQSSDVLGEVEGIDASTDTGGPLKDLGMAQGVHRVVIAGAPTLFHGSPGEFVVLGLALMALRPVDEVHDVVDMTVCNGAQKFGLVALLERARTRAAVIPS
jgi:hypothetical protein